MNRRMLLTTMLGASGALLFARVLSKKIATVQERIDRGEALVGIRIDTDEQIVIRNNTVIDGCDIRCRSIYFPAGTRDFRFCNNTVRFV